MTFFGHVYGTAVYSGVLKYEWKGLKDNEDQDIR